MVCSSCGYDNPREHRYCGMCGTPFPYRPLTVPGAQSTLTFSTSPLEIAPAPLPIHTAEPPASLKAEPEEPPAVSANADTAREPRLPTTEVPAIEPLVESPVIGRAEFERVEVVEAVPPATPPVEPMAEVPEPAPIRVPVEPLPAKPVEEAPPQAPPAVEAASAAPAIEPEPAGAYQADTPAEPVAAEPKSSVPAIDHEALTPQPEIAAPKGPAPHIVVRPAAPPRVAQPAPAGILPAKRPAAHPSPDSLPITPPPDSAGMPTFQSIAEASGAPAISPFEPPSEKHPDEDRELQEYVASFRYTPPVETADELTMRSEVPVIDSEAPAAFHHASFDDDVPPPPEAGPHPTGEEYYPPPGTAPRARFLEISDTDKSPVDRPASGEPLSQEPGGSFPSMLASYETTPQVHRRKWLWSSLAALIAICGGLGFLEGRAQSTHAFRGPMQIVRDQYNQLRERLAKSGEAPAAAPVSSDTVTEKQLAPAAKPATAEKAADPQPDTSTKANPSANEPASTTVPSQPTTQPVAKQPDAATNATPTTETAKAEPAKPIESPPPKPSTKPQPGQQELNKAIDASDPAAAAAWLWKSTSRGNPEAPIRLADMYIKGKGVPKSCEQALVLLRSAAIKENAPARNRLAALYANGTCVARDRVKAYQLMSSALVADPSSEWAQQNRKEMWNQMSPEERAEAEKYR